MLLIICFLQHGTHIIYLDQENSSHTFRPLNSWIYTRKKNIACLLLWVLIVDKWNRDKFGKDGPYREDEYTIGRGEMVDLFILLMSPAISCSSKYLFILL